MRPLISSMQMAYWRSYAFRWGEQALPRWVGLAAHPESLEVSSPGGPRPRRSSPMSPAAWWPSRWEAMSSSRWPTSGWRTGLSGGVSLHQAFPRGLAGACRGGREIRVFVKRAPTHILQSQPPHGCEHVSVVVLFRFVVLATRAPHPGGIGVSQATLAACPR